LGFLGDLFREVGCALRLRQVGTTYVKSGHRLNAGNHDINSGMLRKADGLGKLDLTVLDRGFIGSDFHRQALFP
jgi:hypothetical protein